MTDGPRVRIWVLEIDEGGLAASIHQLARHPEKLLSIAGRHRLVSLEIVPSNVAGYEPDRFLLARIEGPAGDLTAREYGALEEDIRRETGVSLDAVNAFRDDDDRGFAIDIMNLRCLFDSRTNEAAAESG